MGDDDVLRLKGAQDLQSLSRVAQHAEHQLAMKRVEQCKKELDAVLEKHRCIILGNVTFGHTGIIGTGWQVAAKP